MAEEYILLRHRDIPHLDQLDVYLANGGFGAFRKAVTTMQPLDVLNEVKNSGLRGRGGAGFPTGLKWSFIPNNIWPHYVVANADESEPGTFKDREILEGNPFQFLEGLMIASYAVQANLSYVYLRGEFWQIGAGLEERIAQLEKAGLLGDNLFGNQYSLRLHTHLGAGAYICGEEIGHARIDRRQAGSAAPAPALPGCPWPVWQAHRDQQRGDAGQCPANYGEGRLLVSLPGHRAQPGGEDFLPVGLRQ